jgi:hypothetical protein
VNQNRGIPGMETEVQKLDTLISQVRRDKKIHARGLGKKFSAFYNNL